MASQLGGLKTQKPIDAPSVRVNQGTVEITITLDPANPPPADVYTAVVYDASQALPTPIAYLTFIYMK